MPPLLAIVGETASGKSALALEVAQKLNGELICADSWTVYEGFDIGTAKPSIEEQALVPHHLLDVADPRDGFSAVLFQRLAKEAIHDISSRGKLPILVGGTGLYIDSVLYDYGFLAPPPFGMREQLSSLSLQQLHEQVATQGLSAEGIDLQNKRRVIRLIENGGTQPTKQPLRDDTRIVGLIVDRDHLRERVERRVDVMLTQGLETEVKNLVETYGWDVEPMKGIGYREWQDYFNGSASMDQTRERILKATMDLAKRQRTWFKRNSSIQWLSDRSNAVDFITTILNKSH